MAQLSENITASIFFQGDEVVFSLRTPTNEELNKFLSSRWTAGKRGGIKDDTHTARCRFFDRLFTGIQNLNDPSGNPVTGETKNLIPANWKAAIILELFEDIEVDLKN